MQLVKKHEWTNRAAKRRIARPLKAPCTGHWNGPAVRVSGNTTWDHSRCAALVRGIQKYHMDGNGWFDIAYNFIVCPHNYVFEGRGLNVENGGNGTTHANQNSHAIMWLAGDGNVFTDSEKRTFRECIDYVVQNTGCQNGSVGHRDHKKTACPGNERYNWIHQGMPISGITYVSHPPTSSGTPVLKLGTRGEGVRRVQSIIRDHAGGDIAVDGMFGPATKRRVKDVQRFFGLVDDGIVGPKTWELLNYLAAGAPTNNTPEKPTTPTPKNTNRPNLKRGAKDDHVRHIQQTIHDKAGGDISVDGDFGPQTERRVKDVQRFFGLVDDGIVGPKTWEVIDLLSSL